MYAFASWILYEFSISPAAQKILLHRKHATIHQLRSFYIGYTCTLTNIVGNESPYRSVRCTTTSSLQSFTFHIAITEYLCQFLSSMKHLRSLHKNYFSSWLYKRLCSNFSADNKKNVIFLLR